MVLEALRYLDVHSIEPEEGTEQIKADWRSLRLALYQNATLAGLKAGQFDAAKKSATFALNFASPPPSDAEQAKAYYRRGLANLALKDSASAERDFRTACQLAPTDAGPRQELQKIVAVNAERKKKEQQAYKKMFA